MTPEKKYKSFVGLCDDIKKKFPSDQAQAMIDELFDRVIKSDPLCIGYMVGLKRKREKTHPELRSPLPIKEEKT